MSTPTIGHHPPRQPIGPKDFHFRHWIGQGESIRLIGTQFRHSPAGIDLLTRVAILSTTIQVHLPRTIMVYHPTSTRLFLRGKRENL